MNYVYPSSNKAMKLKTGQQIKQKNRLREVCVWFDVCPLKRFYEQGKLDRKWIENYCWADSSKCVRKKMEEQGIYHPDNMMPDGTIEERL